MRLLIMSKITILLFQFKCEFLFDVGFLARGRSSLSLGRLMALKYSHLGPHLNWILFIFLISKSVEPNEEQKVLASGMDQEFSANT